MSESAHSLASVQLKVSWKAVSADSQPATQQHQQQNSTPPAPATAAPAAAAAAAEAAAAVSAAAVAWYRPHSAQAGARCPRRGAMGSGGSSLFKSVEGNVAH